MHLWPSVYRNPSFTTLHTPVHSLIFVHCYCAFQWYQKRHLCCWPCSPLLFSLHLLGLAGMELIFPTAALIGLCCVLVFNFNFFPIPPAEYRDGLMVKEGTWPWRPSHWSFTDVKRAAVKLNPPGREGYGWVLIQQVLAMFCSGHSHQDAKVSTTHSPQWEQPSGMNWAEKEWVSQGIEWLQWWHKPSCRWCPRTSQAASPALSTHPERWTQTTACSYEHLEEERKPTEWGCLLKDRGQ